MSQHRGYLGLQMLVGFSSKYQDGPIKELSSTIETFIETSTCTIEAITVSKTFYGRLTEEVGYPVHIVDTLIGEASISVRDDQHEDVLLHSN